MSATYGMSESQAFHTAIPAADQVALDAATGAATRRSATTLLIAIDAVATTSPRPARTTSVMSFAAR